MLADLPENLAARHLEIFMRAKMQGDYVTKEPGFVRYISGEPHPFGNLAFLADPSDAETAKKATTPLVECGAPSLTLLASPITPDAQVALEQNGFQFAANMPAMIADIANLPKTSLPDGYTFTRILDANSAEAWTETMGIAYGLPAKLARLFAPATLGLDPSPDADIQFFAILKEGRPVATSVLYIAGGVAGLYCVATLAEERRKGLGAHITAEPLRAAQALGYNVAVLQASQDGYPVYKRLGFQDSGAVQVFIRMPA